MSLAGLRNLAVGLCTGGLLSVPGWAQEIDEWHYIDRDSVLHTELVDGLHGAGVIQSDQIFALLYLGPPGENAVVSVVLPTVEAEGPLTSTLTRSNGLTYARIVTGAELDVARVNETDHAFSFPIPSEDIRLFQRATTWDVQVGEQTWSVTLRGSNKAIRQAKEMQSLHMERMRRPAARLDLD